MTEQCHRGLGPPEHSRELRMPGSNLTTHGGPSGGLAPNTGDDGIHDALWPDGPA